MWYGEGDERSEVTKGKCPYNFRCRGGLRGPGRDEKGVKVKARTRGRFT